MSPEELTELSRQFELANALADKEAEHQAEIEGLLRAIIDVLDAYDRVHSDGSNQDSVRLIAKQFAAAVKDIGLEVLGWPGEVAAPDTHQVIETRAVDGTPGDVVVEVLRRGYQFKGRVLRPAEVIVAAGAEEQK